MWTESHFFKITQKGVAAISSGTIGFDLNGGKGRLSVIIMAKGISLKAGVYTVIFTQPFFAEGHQIKEIDIEIRQEQLHSALEAEFSIVGQPR